MFNETRSLPIAVCVNRIIRICVNVDSVHSLSSSIATNLFPSYQFLIRNQLRVQVRFSHSNFPNAISNSMALINADSDFPVALLISCQKKKRELKTTWIHHNSDI